SSISKIGSDPLKLVHDAVEETTDWVYGFFSLLSDIISSEGDEEDDDDAEEDADKGEIEEPPLKKKVTHKEKDKVKEKEKPEKKEEKKAKTREKIEEKIKKEVKGVKQEKVKQTAAKVKEVQKTSPKPKKDEKDAAAVSKHEQKDQYAFCRYMIDIFVHGDLKPEKEEEKKKAEKKVTSETRKKAPTKKEEKKEEQEKKEKHMEPAKSPKKEQSAPTEKHIKATVPGKKEEKTTKTVEQEIRKEKSGKTSSVLKDKVKPIRPDCQVDRMNGKWLCVEPEIKKDEKMSKAGKEVKPKSPQPQVKKQEKPESQVKKEAKPDEKVVKHVKATTIEKTDKPKPTPTKKKIEKPEKESKESSIEYFIQAITCPVKAQVIREKILKMYQLQRRLKPPSASSSVSTWMDTMAMDFSFLSLLRTTLERALANRILQDRSNDNKTPTSSCSQTPLPFLPLSSTIIVSTSANLNEENGLTNSVGKNEKLVHCEKSHKSMAMIEWTAVQLLLIFQEVLGENYKPVGLNYCNVGKVVVEEKE
ncbi:hypothetical protein MG293_010846, partial [Ovis ammon polii]